jgi:hypothetical protein
MTGEVDGLFPGVETVVQATVTNQQTFTIVVTALTVRALDSSTDCPGSLLQFGQLASTVGVSPGAATVVRIPVRLDVGAPDACQGATWPLEFSGTAVSVDSGAGGGGGGGGGGSILPPTGGTVGGIVAIAAGLVVVGHLALRPRRLREERESRDQYERGTR